MRASTALILPASALAVLLTAGGVVAEDDATAASIDQTPPETEVISDEGVDEQPSLPPEVAARMAAMRAGGAGAPKQEFPKFDDVAKDYEKVISSADGARSFYTLWTRKKDGQMLAELPRSFGSQKLFIAYTVAGGTLSSGVQTGDKYAYWKRFDKRLALIEPNFTTRTTGDLESKKGTERVFTDRVILDVPIVTMGPSGGPVIDMDSLLVGRATSFFGFAAAGGNPSLATIEKAKAFPQNVEIAYKLPMQGGKFGTLHYSLSLLPENTGYRPRAADPRVGYFTTSYRDIGHPGKDTPWVRYVNRWKLEKADPKLSLSPPKEPIVFYLEHTIPVRYRRWVREGVLEWNKAFEKVGLVNAIEVYQQDARTGAHMEKDPEDARYDFVLWTNSGMGYAIGPSRVDPRTGQIIDADIVMDEGFISSWVNAWRKVIPQVAMRNFDPQALAWLQTRPQWDPRVRLVPPAQRSGVIRQLAADPLAYGGNPAAHADHHLLGDDAYDGLSGRVSQVNGGCEYAISTAFEMALFRLDTGLLAELEAGLVLGTQEEDPKTGDPEEEDPKAGDPEDEDPKAGDPEDDDAEEAEEDDAKDDDAPEKPEFEQMLDGVPESFVGPLLKDVIMHEVGHTLGLRHNFKASSVYSLEEINSPEHAGKPITGSVMDYTPININVEDGAVQGPYGMVTLGDYDYWAIEYGYGPDAKLKDVVKRVAEPGLAYATDEDSWGSDPLVRTFDLGTDPLAYSESQMRLVTHLRGKILDRMVKDGESWAKARQGYELLLGRQMGAVSIAANWLGGAHANRDLKGDPGARTPVTPVSVEQQRRALGFVMDNAFRDEAFGLTPELLSKMTIDKWWDDEGFFVLFEDAAWPVHERILGIQASALTMVMNPSTLARVYDNEFRIPADDDALTLPEMIGDVSDEIWSELDASSTKKFTNRKPMVSSLRRNLQREHLERLIDLSFPNPMLGVAAKPVSTLSTYKLRELHGKIEKVVDRKGARVDDYTLAHLSEARIRIEKALDAQYIYNTDDMRSSGPTMSFPMFGEEGR